jgi:hypothetical protein
MNSFTNIFLVGFLVYSIFSFIFGIKKRKNPFGLSRFFLPLGSFVWIDNVVFGMFFILITLFSLLMQQSIFFWLVFSVFWLVRSIGEQMYWFHEQFAATHRNNPNSLWPYRWFKGQEVWVVMQIFWQCVAVILLISSFYFLKEWLL